MYGISIAPQLTCLYSTTLDTKISESKMYLIVTTISATSNGANGT